MRAIRTQVGIIGAGPAGLTLARLLQLHSIESVVIEIRSRKHVEERVRAGVLEQGTVDLLVQIGAGERLKRQGLVHRGIVLRFNGCDHRIDMHELTGGQCITIYGQNELVRDLTSLRLDSGGETIFEAEDVNLHEIDNDAPRVRFRSGGTHYELACDFVAGCDGFHGICRSSIPSSIRTEFERTYPFGWLGILAGSRPPSEELIYTHHDRGFALVSMRTPEISRLYLQCAPDEDIANWPDERIWKELHARLALKDRDFKLAEGPVLQKGVTGMRSFVVEPMQYGNLFLAGDAAHIVPPTGAKGLNLAVADTVFLARALGDFYSGRGRDGLNCYSETCLQRVWKVQRFSWWMTSMLHRFEFETPFDHRRQLAELDYVTSSRAASTSLAENYVGLPVARTSSDNTF